MKMMPFFIAEKLINEQTNLKGYDNTEPACGALQGDRSCQATNNDPFLPQGASDKHVRPVAEALGRA